MGLSAQVFVAVVMLAAACHRADDEQEVRPPAVAPESMDAIPDGPLAGMLRRQEFEHQVATYVVDRRRGYEHFDIRLAAQQAEDPCARGPGAGGTSVWVRRWGASAIEAATVRLTPGKESEWEVHYQQQEQEQWVGNGEASALLVLAPPGPDLTVRGELWACFADAHQSCVSGTFQARYCPIKIDQPIRGTRLMERPSARPPSAPAPSANTAAISSQRAIGPGPAGSGSTSADSSGAGGDP